MWRQFPEASDKDGCFSQCSVCGFLQNAEGRELRYSSKIKRMQSDKGKQNLWKKEVFRLALVSTG